MKSLTNHIHESLGVETPVLEAINNRQMEQALRAIRDLLMKGGVEISLRPLLYAFGDKNYSFIFYNDHRQGGLINWSQRTNSQVTSVVFTSNIDHFSETRGTYLWDAYVDTTEMNTAEVAKFIRSAMDGSHNFSANDLKPLLRSTIMVESSEVSTKVKGSLDLDAIQDIASKIKPYDVDTIETYLGELEAAGYYVADAFAICKRYGYAPQLEDLYTAQIQLDSGVKKSDVARYLKANL